MNERREWIHAGVPRDPGWYAVLLCWDEQEGLFPACSYWDGTRWDRSRFPDERYPVAAFLPEPMADKTAAEAFAYENDPDK